jgi:glucokinase
MTSYYLALDFGGTKHAAGLIERGSRHWLEKRQVLAPPNSDGETDRRVIFELAGALLASHPGELAAIGVSFGGPVDWKSGRVILSHHVPGWEDTPLVAMLHERYRVPAIMDNDANVAALGEWRFGAGQGCESLLYITVSTGIGGGWVLGGKIHRGADSMAGEIGHLAVDPDGPECVCSKRGCVEAIGSGTNIGRAMNERRGETRWTGIEVDRAAEAGDPEAIAVMESAARALGIGIGYAITLMNPGQVIIGGGVANAGQVYWRTLRATAASYVLPQMRVEILPAALGGESPLWGAVALTETLD